MHLGRIAAACHPMHRRSYAVLYTVIDRSIARITVFPSKEAALEAVGLREAMSEHNVKVLKAFAEAFNDRDFDDALRYLDRAVEINPGVRAPDHDLRLLGHEGWKEFIRVAIEVWEVVTAEPLERIETEDGRILSIDLWRLRGRDGIEIERELPTLYTFREGLIVRIDGFTGKAEALEAAGLRE